MLSGSAPKFILIRDLSREDSLSSGKAKRRTRGNLHGANDRLSTFLTQYGGKIALVQRSQSVI